MNFFSYLYVLGVGEYLFGILKTTGTRRGSSKTDMELKKGDIKSENFSPWDTTQNSHILILVSLI